MNSKAFFTGEVFDAYETFGAHPLPARGVRFCVWAPAARRVELIGEFNGWDGTSFAMIREGSTGIYTLTVSTARPGQMYKYRIYQPDGQVFDRTDPYGFGTELRPNTASIVVDLDAYTFTDEAWMHSRDKNYDHPLNIYEVHCGSWRSNPENENGWYTYDQLAKLLIPYVKDKNYTHIELMPLCEFPADESWGYQTSGFFSPTARYGTAQQLMEFVDLCHKEKIGVILDFVPVHFVVDNFALSLFDGSALYEYPNKEAGMSEWGSCNFNFYRGEVRSFLQSSANYWLEKFHFDGMRFDAISRALYWQGEPSRGVNSGGIAFLRALNEGLEKRHPDVMRIAEDSTAYPKVTAPVKFGGLGFDYKWDMGWMNDTLRFFAMDPIYRKSCYGQLRFSMDYFYNELFLLAFSHDENVHGKKTVLDKMYGTYEQKFAQGRVLYMYMYAHPGKKLSFMGNELGHFREWDEKRELDWGLLEYPVHGNFLWFMMELNKIYLEFPALYTKEYDSNTFCWADVGNSENCIYAFIRGKEGDKRVLAVLNPDCVAYEELYVTVPGAHVLRELLNTDEERFSGTGKTNLNEIQGENGVFCLRLGELSGTLFAIE